MRRTPAHAHAAHARPHTHARTRAPATHPASPVRAADGDGAFRFNCAWECTLDVDPEEEDGVWMDAFMGGLVAAPGVPTDAGGGGDAGPGEAQLQIVDELGEGEEEEEAESPVDG